jgi:hypothetical protein
MPRNSSGMILRYAASLAATLVVAPAFWAQAAGTAPPAAEPIVNQASTVVETFLGHISDVECLELVSQTRLKPDGKAEATVDSSFDYVVLAESNGGELTLSESRLAKQTPKASRNLPLMVTNGFSTMLLIFHPDYRAGYEFTWLGEEVVDGKTYARLGFRHIPGLRSTTALLVRGREYPLDLQGEAWVALDTGEVWKITSGLEKPMEDIGLRSLTAQVIYSPVTFQGTSKTYWLPKEAVIEVESPRQHWRNVHRFTAYHQFATDVKEKISGQP